MIWQRQESVESYPKGCFTAYLIALKMKVIKRLHLTTGVRSDPGLGFA